MLEYIKSSFILKKIFTYIDNRVKFKSVKYNKKIQKKLGLNIIDFRRISGKYIEENKGYIIEYNGYNNRTLFEGYYSNGKKNGKGKEYNEENKLIFEGEYLNGKKYNGHGKEYDEDTGNLIFEFNYLNGKITGKEYDKFNGDLLFDGNYLDGKRSGFGKEYKYIPCKKSNNKYSKQIIIFIGEYLNGERIKGKEYNYDEKIIYEGEYLNGKKWKRKIV